MGIYVWAETSSVLSSGQSSEITVGPGNFKIGPGFQVHLGKFARIEVSDSSKHDSLVLHDDAKLMLATASVLLVGNNSSLFVLPNKAVSLAERCMLDIPDNIHCLVVSDVTVNQYTKVVATQGAGNLTGMSCFAM